MTQPDCSQGLSCRAGPCTWTGDTIHTNRCEVRRELVGKFQHFQHFVDEHHDCKGMAEARHQHLLKCLLEHKGLLIDRNARYAEYRIVAVDARQRQIVQCLLKSILVQ